MASSVGANLGITGGYSANPNQLYRAAADAMAVGSNGFPALNFQYNDAAAGGAGETLITWGAGGFVSALAAGAEASVDLTTLKDEFGQTLAIASVKLFVVAIVGPNGTLQAAVGRFNHADAVTLGFSPVTASRDFHQGSALADNQGWTVDGTTFKLYFKNTGAAAVTLAWFAVGG